MGSNDLGWTWGSGGGLVLLFVDGTRADMFVLL